MRFLIIRKLIASLLGIVCMSHLIMSFKTSKENLEIAYQQFGINYLDETQKFNTGQKYIYLLDSGHGFRRNSCGSHKSVVDINDPTDTCFYEHEFNIEVRNFLAEMLDSVGIAYNFIGEFYTDIDLNTRLQMIQDHQVCYAKYSNLPTVLFSVHANAAKEHVSDAKGFSVYIPKNKLESKYTGVKHLDKLEKSAEIATIFMRHIKSVFPESKGYTYRGQSPNKPYFERNLFMTARPSCYAVLTENNFFTNPEIRMQMSQPWFQKKVAEAHFLTIMELEGKYKPILD